MRKVHLILILTIGGVAAQPIQAGLYNPAEAPIGPGVLREGNRAIPLAPFRSLMTDLIKIGIDLQPVSPLRKHSLERQHELELKIRSGAASATDRVSLSAYLVRLRKYEEAVEVLTPAAAQERGNFMLLANLATANQLAGRTSRALDYLIQVKDVGPRDVPGWTPQQRDWYRQAETYHLKLVRLRALEERNQAGGRPKTSPSVDDLFGVRFVGESGQYQAGSLAAAEKQKLPRDAVAIVQQLLIWLPDDTRLYWLLGELLNAQGDVAEAAVVFDDCVGTRNYGAEELRQHRKVLKEAPVTAAGPAVEPLLPAEEPPASWVPDKQHLVLVGAVVGLVLLGLAYLQIRELHRRRRAVGSGQGTVGSGR